MIRKKYNLNKRNWKKIILIQLFFVLTNIFYYLNNKKYNNIDFDLVIPIGQNHINLFNKHKKFYDKYLSHKNIIIISQSNTELLLEKDSSIIFINEDTLISKAKINKFLKEKRNITTNRVGWYKQQFVKMLYARICKKEYYLIWDCDTIPIKSIQMFEKKKPFFDMRILKLFPYFRTLNKIIPGLKYSNLSFVTEHQMIKTKYMKNLIENIERNDKLEGKFFWEKILMAIEFRYICSVGFSEYETYGSFVETRYPNSYIIRNWSSLRIARKFYGNIDNLEEKDINWLSKDFYALSFEKWCSFDRKKLEIVKNVEFQKKYKPIQFLYNFNKIFGKHKKI